MTQLVFLKWVIPGLFFVYLRLLKNYNFYNKYVKNVHPVYGPEIRTHDLQYVSLLPLPLDQGAQLVTYLFISFNLQYGTAK